MEQDTDTSPITIPPELDPTHIIQQNGEFTGAIADEGLAKLASDVSQGIYKGIEDPEGYKKLSEASMPGLTAATTVNGLTREGISEETAVAHTVEKGVINTVQKELRQRVQEMNPDASEEKQKELADLLVEKVTQEWEVANEQRLQKERERIAAEAKEKLDKANAEVDSIIERLKGPEPPTIEELLPGFRAEALVETPPVTATETTYAPGTSLPELMEEMGSSGTFQEAQQMMTTPSPEIAPTLDSLRDDEEVE